MSVLVDLTPTNVEFLREGKIYKIGDIMKNGDHGLTIFADEKEEETTSVISEPKVAEENEPIKEPL